MDRYSEILKYKKFHIYIELKEIIILLAVACWRLLNVQLVLLIIVLFFLFKVFDNVGVKPKLALQWLLVATLNSKKAKTLLWYPNINELGVITSGGVESLWN